MVRQRLSLNAILAFSLLTGFALAAPVRAEEVTLQFWELSAGEDVIRPLLDKFESRHPGIRVHLQQLSWDYGLDKITTAVAAGNPPDVCDLGTDWVPKFAATGVLRDLTEDLAPLRDAHVLWEPVTYEGRLYGAPWLAGTRILFYNRALFAQSARRRFSDPANLSEPDLGFRPVRSPH